MTSRNSSALPEWASRITALRQDLGISQEQLAQRMACSAMTVSRWERGLQAPTADFYIQLGKLAGTKDCWFFWEHAGLRVVDLARVLPGHPDQWAMARNATPENVEAERAAFLKAYTKQTVALPLLKTVAGSHGIAGDKTTSIDRLPSSQFVGVPTEWCVNPRYTSLLRVRGHSMEPLIHNGDIVAVDFFQSDRTELVGKIVLVAHEEKGLCVSRLHRYEDVYVLESNRPDYEGVVLRNSGWQVVGRVLWRLSNAP